MPSPAAKTYQTAAARARLLLTAASEKRLRPMTSAQVQTYLHASLAAVVAAWDAYIHNLVRDFFLEVADPLVSSFQSIHSIAKAAADFALERFNTPNWDNTRNLLVRYTGYDPMPDWVWLAGGMNVAQVKERLDQILRVRHSFAHGFPLPAYPWTQSKNGQVRLTSGALRSTHGFFRNLVARSDKGMEKHIVAAYGKRPHW
jgi:RiboL-PSP-HEPN